MAKYIVINGIRIDKDYQNFVPETFGRLTTIGPKFRIANRTYQVCQCSCVSGTIVVVNSTQMHFGKTKSCGCLVKEKLSKASRRHGGTGTAEFSGWRKMKGRCLDKANNRYYCYGGRGIHVCARWLEPNGQGFINFLADMGRKPSPRHTIDRYPDKNGDYCPENCRWATPEEQANNRTTNLLVCVGGIDDTLANWCRKYNQDYKRVFARISKGWDVLEALTAPKNKRRSK